MSVASVHLVIFSLFFHFVSFTSHSSAVSHMILSDLMRVDTVYDSIAYVGRDMKRQNIKADRMRHGDESHASIMNPLVFNQLDMAIDQLILHLHILISLFLQMNGDVLCTRAWSHRIIILWSVFFCNCECDEFLLAKPMQSKQCNRQHCLSAGRGRDRIKLSDIWEKEWSERKASKGDWKTRAFIHWLVIH